MTDDPMHPFDNALRLRQARRCGARTRSGSTCRSPAVSGKTRCRMHGGATGSGGPLGERNGNYRHGRYTKDNEMRTRSVRKLVREVKELTKMLRASVPAALISNRR
jgi:hypothetical protein